MWSGSDSYASLKEHGIGKPVNVLAELGYKMFLGGDLSFLATNYGLS